MRVRAHHLLCAFQFRGYGYSEAFVPTVTPPIAARPLKGTPGYRWLDGGYCRW